jgi:hypothetical protein
MTSFAAEENIHSATRHRPRLHPTCPKASKSWGGNPEMKRDRHPKNINQSRNIYPMAQW